jgi:hypothetical protein
MTVHKVLIRLLNKDLQRIAKKIVPMKTGNIDVHRGYNSDYGALRPSDWNDIHLSFS